MTGYRYLLDCTVAEELLNIPARFRENLLMVFRQIADNPFQPGDSSFHDSSGRAIQKRRFGMWQISYWSDDAVREVRIVGVQRIRR